MNPRNRPEPPSCSCGLFVWLKAIAVRVQVVLVQQEGCLWVVACQAALVEVLCASNTDREFTGVVFGFVALWVWILCSEHRTSSPPNISPGLRKPPSIGASKIVGFVDTPWRDSTQKGPHRGIKDFLFCGFPVWM